MDICAALASLLSLAAAVTGVVGFVGCARTPAVGQGHKSPVALVWPEPPDAPRIVFVRSFSRPADLGIKGSAIGRFARWVTGAGQRDQDLMKPFGIALDENDNLCLTDTGANAVCFWERAAGKWRRWNKAGKLPLISPVAVAKRKQIVYVADSGRRSVIAFDPSGRLLFQVTNHLEHPAGLTLAGDRLIVTDSRRHRLVAFDLLGNYLSEFGRRGVGPGEFNFPTHVATDRDGNLLVTDSMNSRVQILDPQGRFHGQIGSLGDSSGHFTRPKGVAADTFGHLYVVDALFDNIQVFDREGRFLLYLGQAGEDPGQFWMPNGIAISAHDEIFVTDSYNRRVQIFRYIGRP